MTRRSITAVLVWTALLGTARAGAAASASYSIDVAVELHARTVRGSETVTFAAPADGTALFYLFANRLAGPPAGLTDVDFYWYFPRTLSPGGISVSGATQDGRPLATEVADLSPGGRRTLLRVGGLRGAAGQPVTVRLDFSVTVPERFGDFGCTDDVCVLMGGFYPMLVARDADGWALHDLPEPAAYALRVTTSAGAGVVALGRSLTAAADGIATTSVDRAAYATLIGARELHAETATASDGTPLLWLSQRAAPPPPPDPRPRLLPYIPEDYGAMALAAARHGLALLAQAGVHASADATHPLVLCAVPLREELAEAHPGVVLVSDRIFRIFPLPAFRKFHELALVRALFGTVLETAAPPEALRDRAWVPDAVAAFFVDLYTLELFGGARFAGDLLRYVSFVPQIDQLLYAPTVEFTPIYFQSVYEPDRTRDDLLRWNNELPRGKLIYEKLRDLLGDKAMVDVVRLHLAGRKPFRDAAATVYGHDLSWFFAQWLGPLPRVNYRLVGYASTRAAGGYADQVTVDKEGDTTLIEPVDVAVTTRDGATTALRWDGVGASHTFSWTSTDPISEVVVDPHDRLVENDLGRNVDPRFDDRSPHPYKFLYNNIGAAYDAGSRKLAIDVDFSIWRVHDLANAVRLAPFKSFAEELGLLASYQRYFGRKADPHRRAGEWANTIVAARLDPSFAGQPPGTVVSLHEGLAWDDRDFLYEPWRDDAASIGGSGTLTDFDRGGAAWTWSADGAASAVRTPIPGTTLGALLDGAVVGGELRSVGQLVAPGSLGGLRGYAANALFGRAAALGSLEVRQSFVHDLDVNLLHAAYLRGVGGVLFADGGTVSGCSGYGLFGAGTFYGDVGGSLRFFLDWAGISQTLLSIDVATPLQRTVPVCGAAPGAPTRVNVPPIEVGISFAPAF